jgi:hypothetical protein
MESSTTNRTAPSRPGRSHRRRALAVTALAVGTLIAALAPVTICSSDRGPFDPAFGQPAASR